MNKDNRPAPVILYSGALILFLLASCTETPQETTTMFDETPNENASRDEHQAPTDVVLKARQQMVATQLVSRDIVNKRVLAAMRKVPR